jgi:prepilin-type N-terminal cleavage/methylation domain-containing protein
MKTAPAIQGLTLIEIMVVLAVLGIVLAVAAPSFAELLNRQRVRAVAAELSTDLALARAETGLRPQDVTVRFGKNSSLSCYTAYYYGGSGNCDCTRAPSETCNGQVTEFRTNRVPASYGVEIEATGTWPKAYLAGMLNFRSPQMTASVPDFAVTVRGRSGATLRVQLNGMGRVLTCAPDGNFSGVARC